MLSGLGPLSNSEAGIASQGTRAIVQAMQATDVRRLVVVSAAPIGTVPSPGLPVRVSPKPGIKEAAIVRPDGYVAGRGAPGEEARLLDLLARALEAPAERRGS